MTLFRNNEPFKKTFSTLQFSPCGRYVITGSFYGNIVVWDYAADKEVVRIVSENASIAILLVSSDRRMILSVNSRGLICGWDFDTGACLFRLNEAPDQDDSQLVISLAISPDNRYLISSHREGVMKIWDLSARLCIKTIQCAEDAWARSLVLSPCGTIIYSAYSDSSVRFWTFKTGQCLKTLLAPHHAFFYDTYSSSGELAISSDGKFFVSQIEDKYPAPAYSAIKEEAISCSSISATVMKLYWKRISCIEIANKTYDVYQFKSLHSYIIGEYVCSDEEGKPRFALYGEIRSMQYSDTEPVVYTIKSDDTKQGSIIAAALCNYLLRVEKPPIKLTENKMRNMQALWLYLKQHEDAICSTPIVYKTVKFEDYDYAIKVYDLTTNDVAHNIRVNDVYATFVFSPDNRYLLAGNKQHLTVWHLETQKIVRTINGDFSYIQFIDEGKNLISGGVGGLVQRRCFATFELLDSRCFV